MPLWILTTDYWILFLHILVILDHLNCDYHGLDYWICHIDCKTKRKIPKMMDSIAAIDYGNRVLYISFLVNILLFIFVINLVRKRQLSEHFALVWLIIPILLIIFSTNRKLLEWLAAMVGVYYAPAIMIPILFGLFLMVSLYFSIKVSEAEQRIKTLTQELALLKYKVELSEKNSSGESGSDAKT